MRERLPDWRAMVDVVLLVTGRYELPASDGPTTVAVKIIDMLGEEVLVTAKV